MFSPDEYQAVRTAAGLVDRSRRGRILVRGNDRAAYLNGLLSNDIAALRPGTGCYAVYLTPQGRMISDVTVAELGDAMLLDLPAETKQVVHDRLDEFIFSEDVRLEDVTDIWSQAGVHGPRAAAVVAAALANLVGPTSRPDLEGRLAALGEYENETFDYAGGKLVVMGSRETGEIGFTLYWPGSAGALRDLLAGAGATPVSQRTADVLRVEAGRPEFLVDMDQATIPLEAGIEDRAISFTKGCYVGQEVIIRVLHRGHGRVARKLVGLTLPASLDAGAAARVAGAVLSAGDKEIGRVTSAVFSPALNRPIALGYVHRDHAEPGTIVAVASGDDRVSATVTRLPFYAKEAGGGR